MSRVRRWVVAAILVGAVGACGPFCLSGKVVLSNAHLDSKFSCPRGSSDFGYDTHGTVDLDNGTSGTVTIRSVSTTATVVAVHGDWNGSVGAKSGADNISFSPKTVAPGSKTTIKFVTPWQCSDPSGNSQTYADFAVQVILVTSAGTYKINTNNHRLLTP